MIRVIIAEDEPLARDRIARMLKTDAQIEIVSECTNGLDTLKAIQNHPPDLLFLDVQMPEMDGFEVLDALEENKIPHVVFVTAYEQYALRAFEFHALDYLLKPFNEARLLQSLQRAQMEIEKNRTGDIQKKILNLLDEVRSRPTQLKRLLLKDGQRAWFLKVEDIDWIEAEAKYVRLHEGKRSHLLRQSMIQLEARLDPVMFVRIHRSTIVNIDRIREIQALTSGDSKIFLRDGTSLVLSRTYRKNLRDLAD